MAVRRVQVIWSGATVAGGGLMTFWFNDAVGTAAQNVASVGTFLTAAQTQVATGTNWTTAPDVATLNVGTGALESVTSTTPASGGGTAAGDAAPYATQGLLRLITGQIVGGKLLRGRLFLPGVVEASSTGVPTAGYATAWNTPAATLVGDANSEWSVWSRTHGTLASITTASVWSKWSVLRSRRD